MRKTKKIKKTSMVIKTTDIICNICGESCDNNKRKKGKDKYPEHEEYSGLIEIEVSGGYMSEKIGDMCSDRFSICEHCLVDRVYSMFKIPREMKDEFVEFTSEPEYHRSRRKILDEMKKFQKK